MKSNELRIGNWVTCYNHTFRVGVLEKTYCEDMDADEGGFDYNNCEPILITTELLEKSGFWKWSNKFFGLEMERNTLVNDHICIRCKKDGTMKLIVHDGRPNAGFEVNGIKYVHQLQNLYFALIGKELEIKL